MIHRIGKRKISVRMPRRKSGSSKPSKKKNVKKQGKVKEPEKQDEKKKNNEKENSIKLPKKKLQKRNVCNKFDVDQELLFGKQVFLYGVIDDTLVKHVVKKLLALDRIFSREKNPSPITLWINSPGGSVLSGLALIDTMQALRTPVVTVVSGHACSMAGLIAVCGASRVITKNSIWMAHDMSGGVSSDYATKVVDRAEFVKWAQSKIFEILRKHTKLSEKELDKARHGELWLDAEECRIKGVVDVIV